MSHDFAPEGCPARLNRPILGPQQESVMAKGQQRSNKEARKPTKAKVKSNESQPSQKRGLENMKND